jgi:hypothetical protein
VSLREMLVTDWDAITEEASRWHRAYSRGVRGQVVRTEDGYEYWVALATMRRAYERGRADMREDMAKVLLTGHDDMKRAEETAAIRALLTPPVEDEQ